MFKANRFTYNSIKINVIFIYNTKLKEGLGAFNAYLTMFLYNSIVHSFR